ncbi:hypothetical protein EGI22_00990 [Lacihabitans sp. LS3-19]|uniref:YciI family protein n=1 Tax=Lacihabitans sp. LS3-19 TaxID=2487335 RepID=UPI0020CE8E65|nr:YciI family protein [Lacihabitans sp. LS3-19]MCP9766462.1 hypothetical protein [Lacihabitans sp. LS3-19]
MKKILLLLFFGFGVLNLKAQTSTNYDEALAKSLGADEYGMKMYVFVVLKTGGNTKESKTKTDSLFAGHMTNIGKMVENKKLIVAGPFGKNEDSFRGLFILNVSTIDEAKELMQTDPAIKADLLKPDFYPWYGSAALPLYLKEVDKITKKNH